MQRKIYNPIQKDYVTFLEMSHETEGKYTLIEVDLAVGGGVGLHYHKSYNEHFKCTEGILGVEVEGKIYHLQVGEEIMAQMGQRHRFFNPTPQRCSFLCTLSPGNRNFEMMLQIGYGIARNGWTDKKGVPKNKLHLGYLVRLGDTWLTGWRRMFHFFINFWNQKAIKKGIDKELQEFVEY